ncbi:putative ABC transport system permease protein [Catalinimonas alkaloidigena]|uniref:Putative ABC transport system permease protein n=1 Tax=Catalinimonas alkaloidigena TaxID=1075417 RepID=A0A1G8YH12_9BACT|nr:ABC transporter permease [Catalinimonas alkaloidigena]SDK02132.1 putative ABC transport system permease protein [Catalinimonas alkaloidigena]
MLKNYFLVALRNLVKHRFFTGINVVGLAIGMAACLLMTLFVTHELSFDRFHEKNLYRLCEVQQWEGMVAPQNVALSMFPMGPTLQAEFPEIQHYARIFSNGEVPLQYEDQRIYLPQTFWVDTTFLQLFDFELISGDRATALQRPSSVVLTEESAQKLFGGADPLGQTVVRYGNDTTTFTVTGVLKNVPAHSHLQFDGLFSVTTIAQPDWMENWGGNWVNTYLELTENTDVADLEAKFDAFLVQHMGEERAKGYTLFLQPLRDVHGGSTDITHDYHNAQKFDRSYTYVFSILALFVLVIACINFMNLSTARSATRAKEVGIRKAIGAYRTQIARQFLSESILLALAALVLAVLVVKLTLPFVNQLSERSLSLPLFSRPALLLVLLGAALLVGVLAGLYPAAFLSGFHPVKVLKGTSFTPGKKVTLRNVLVVGQFATAIFLIIGTGLAARQLRFMQERNIGFNREQVVILPLSRVANQKYDVLKQELLRHPAITEVTASNQRLGNNLHQTGVKFVGEKETREIVTSQVVVDPDYLSLYQIELVAGRNFSEAIPSDKGHAYIVNESMAKELLQDLPEAPVESLIGRQYGFGWEDTLGTIIGVAKDFNFNSLHHKIETLTIHYRTEYGFSELSMRVDAAQAQDAIQHAEATWASLVPDLPFSYSFLDEHFSHLYQSDRQVSQVIGILAGLAVFIACLGLFGLATFTAEQRTREIGIRKVLGASISAITLLLSKDFLKLVLIAFVVSAPLAWYVMQRWLEDFAYRTDLSWWVFALAGFLAFLIAGLTVSYQAIKASLANPVRTLRSE